MSSGSSSSSSRGQSQYNSFADSMSEYHRDQASSHRSAAGQFGSWDGNKSRKTYYRNFSEANKHDAEKKKWYQARN